MPEGIEAHLAAREYWASSSGDRLQAPNRGQNLRTYFESDGISVVDRTAAGGPRLIDLSLRRFGRESELAPVQPGDVHAEASRVEIHRPGLVEWFENRPEGLEQGAAFLFIGGVGGIANATPATAHAELQGNQVGARMGSSVAASGDVNGDGYDDIILGASSYDAGQGDEGVAMIFLGGLTGIVGTSPASLHALPQGDQASAGFGFSVATFVYLGSTTGIANGGAASAAAQIDGNVASAQMGYSVSSAGDINADGFADVALAANAYPFSFASEGGVFLHIGGGKRGRPTGAFQTRVGLVQPVAASGGVPGTAVDILFRAANPAGRSRAKLRVEYCPNSVPFGHVRCDTQLGSSWADTGVTGVNLSQTISGLVPSILYHWRVRAQFAPMGVTQPGVVSPTITRGGPWRRLGAQALPGDVRPAGADVDADGLGDLTDNCRYEPNPDQSDVAGVAGGGPDGIGDAFQCGDAQNDGAVGTADVVALRSALTLATTPSAPGQAKCSVAGSSSACDVLDFAVLVRTLAPAPPGIAPVCAAAQP